MVFLNAGMNSNVSSVDPHNLMDEAIALHNDCEVARLLPLLEADEIPFSLFSAVTHKYTYAVKLLAPLSGTQNNNSLWVAVSTKYLDGVHVLLPIADPKHHDSVCLQRAVLNNDEAIFELLYPVSDPVVALNGVKTSDQFEEDPSRANASVFMTLEARVLQQTLKDSVSPAQGQTRSNKI